MKNNLRNILLINEGESYLSATFENINDIPDFKQYNNLPLKGCGAAPNVNTLSIVNKFLIQILQEKVNNGSTGMHYIIIPARLCKAIKDGTFKGWVSTGTTISGKPIEENELKQWRLFTALYKELFECIAFKPISIYSASNNGKQYAQSMFIKQVIDEMYEYINLNKEEELYNSLESILG